MISYKNYNLSKLTWFKIGGIAENFFIIETESELKQVLHEFKNSQINILGACSNMLLYDGLIKGAVIKLGGNFSQVSMNQEYQIECGAAVFGKDLSKFACDENLTGLEFFYTIPGTIGGMIKMNAGCYGKEIKDVIEAIYCIDFNGNDYCFNVKDLKFEYRKTHLPKDIIITKGIFNANKNTFSDNSNILNNMKEMNKKRLETQIIGNTCGSTFKNTEKYKAWEVIDRIGMRGYKIGGAMFSEKHCNFIVTNNASYEDVINLIQEAQKRAKDKMNIDLESEIIITKCN